MQKACRLLVFVILFAVSPLLHADTINLNFDKLGIEIGAGYGWMNKSGCRQAISMTGSVGNFCITGRMFRNNYSVFENSLLFGYRYRLHKSIETTLSAGYSDIAFLKDQYEPASYLILSHYTKRIGFCVQFEAETRLYIRKIPTRWGISGAYAVNLNGYRNLSVVSVGLKYHLLPWKESGGLFEWLSRNQERRKQRQAERERKYDGLEKNLIRTKIFGGLLAGTYVEYERTFNSKIGVSIGAAINYLSPPGMVIIESIFGPYSYLRGGEISGGVNAYVEKPHGWWSYGAKLAYRHREREDFYAYVLGDYRRMSMISDDYIFQFRIAYTGRKSNVVKFGWVFSPGIRWSYQIMDIRGWYSTPQTYPQTITIRDNGWDVGPVLNTGFFICFGW